MKKFGKCFTLAEVLITLAIIGVVAALTIPTLWAKLGTIVNSNRKEVIEDRLLEGLNQLNTLDNGLTASQYEDTEGFVKALSKYYKMTQICGANDLQNCFPYSSITYTTDDGEETINVTDLTTAENFKLSSDDYLAPAGFISAQGTPFVMLLKKDCIMDTGLAMRSIPTSCVQYMYDRNGSNNPNKLGTDIIHSASMGLASTANDSGSTVTPHGTFDTPITAGGRTYTKYYIAYPESSDQNPYLDTCDEPGAGMGHFDVEYCTKNYWAGAVEACAELGDDWELPPKEALQEMYCRLNGTQANNYTCSTTTKDTKLVQAFTDEGAPTNSGFYWSSSPRDFYAAYYVSFYSGFAKDYDVNTYRCVVCLGN